MNTKFLKMLKLKIPAPSDSTRYDDSAAMFDFKGGT
jgi:hypothetical protein